MATKKGSKSSKTAHVLNVLSGVKADTGQEEEGQLQGLEEKREPAADQQTQTEVREMPPAVRPPLRTPILEMARANDEALSDQIQHLLEERWQEESGEAPPSAIHEEEDSSLSTKEKREEEPLSAPEPAPAPEPPTASEPIATPEPVPEPAAAPEPAPVAERESVPQSAPPPPLPDRYPLSEEPSEADEFCHVNVMQALVDEKCMRYIKMFGLCDCSRCVADVKALALTNLQSKYLVMHKGEVIPMLTVYEGRYSTALTAQLIQACKVVMDHPRHGE